MPSRKSRSSSIALNLPSIHLPAVQEISGLNTRQKDLLLHRIISFSSRLPVHANCAIVSQSLTKRTSEKLISQVRLIQDELCVLTSRIQICSDEDIGKYEQSLSKFYQLLVSYCRIIIKRIQWSRRYQKSNYQIIICRLQAHWDFNNISSITIRYYMFLG